MQNEKFIEIVSEKSWIILNTYGVKAVEFVSKGFVDRFHIEVTYYNDEEAIVLGDESKFYTMQDCIKVADKLMGRAEINTDNQLQYLVKE